MYFNFTFIDLFNDENSSDESAALLGIINCIFKCVCPDTVYQNKRMLSYCLKPESLTYLFWSFSGFSFSALVRLEEWAVCVASFSISSSMLS